MQEDQSSSNATPQDETPDVADLTKTPSAGTDVPEADPAPSSVRTTEVVKEEASEPEACDTSSPAEEVTIPPEDMSGGVTEDPGEMSEAQPDPPAESGA